MQDTLIHKPETWWRSLSSALILCLFLLCLFNWIRFPFFLDIYYHLNVMRGFNAAGGLVTHAFWELAPEGTVHLYPPLLHLFMLIPYKLGFDLLFIARFFSVASFISLVSALNFVVRKLISPKLAFFVTLSACLPYSFFLKTTITIPASLSLTFIILAFYALENKKRIASSLLVSASFYTHLGIPWMGVLSFLVYGLMRREKLKEVFSVIFISLLFSTPILIHTASNLDKLEGIFGITVNENRSFEFCLSIYLFATIGLISFKKNRLINTCLFFIALTFGLLPMAVNYKYRFFSGEGMLPFIFFAGIGLEKIHDFINSRLAKKTSAMRLGLVPVSIAAVLFIFCPTVSYYNVSDNSKKTDFFLFDSTATNLIPSIKKHVRPIEISLFDEELSKWVELINKDTSADDIICSNWTYIGSALSAFSGRANAAQLFYEMKRPVRQINESEASKLFVLLKKLDGSYDSESLKTAMEKYKFKVIARTNNAIILLKEKSLKSKTAKPIIKTGAALFILFCVSFAICYDLARPRNKFSSLSRSSLE